MKTIRFSQLISLGFFLMILAAKTQGFIARPGLKCWGNPADIVFVLDSSSSIWEPHFKKQLEFVKYMVDHLDIGLGPNQVRIGVETFSDFAHVNIDLADSTDRISLKNRIDNIRHMTGTTNIGDALRQLLSTMFKPNQGSRPNVRRVAIILTDGTSQDKTGTQEAAKACRDANIELFAIGIGHYVDYSELRGIASEPKSKFLFQTPNYDTLDQIREDVIHQTCQAVTTVKPTTTTKRTTTPTFPSDMEVCKNKIADVFFLLDSSSSIQIEDFKKEINVVENIVSQFDIGPTKTRVGLSVFGHEYYPMLSLEYGANKVQALKEIRKMKYAGGGTETGKALHEVRTYVFNKESIRRGAERILIVFTDGKSRNYEQTLIEARLLRESGIKIFAVGIGPDVDQIELRDISSQPFSQFLHTFATFDILLKKSGLLTEKACTIDQTNIFGDQNACNATQPTDVVFMVSNNHFGKEKTNLILKASAEVVREFGENGNFRFGTIFDVCLPQQDIQVGSTTKESRFVNYNPGTIASLAAKLRTGVFPSGSFNVRRVGLVFLDYTVDLRDRQIQMEMKRATFKGIDIYAVIIGNGVNEELVQRHIASAERIIKIHSYDDLVSYMPSQFAQYICKRVESTFKPVIS